jgi:hypothetical protein
VARLSDACTGWKECRHGAADYKFPRRTQHAVALARMTSALAGQTYDIVLGFVANGFTGTP